MLEEKMNKIERSLADLREVQEKATRLIQERKLKFAMTGVNDVLKTIAEIMVLEKVLDNLNETIDVDGGEIEILTKKTIKDEVVPEANEMLNYISLKYRDDLSDECQVLKKFIDEIQYQTITRKLFEQNWGA